MSITTRALFSVASALAGNEIRRLISNLDVEDVLRPVGLTRRRSHVGTSLLFLGAGVVVGGATVLAVGSLKREEVIRWLSRNTTNPKDSADLDEGKDEQVLHTDEPGNGRGNHHEQANVTP